MKPATPIPWRVSNGGWSDGSGNEGGWVEATDPTRGTFYTGKDGQPVLSPTTGVHICWFGTRDKPSSRDYRENAVYIVHTANQYPRLVDALKNIDPSHPLLKEIGE